jgi:hypothetical protein
MSASSSAESAVSAVTSVSEAINAVANAPETISNLFKLTERLVYGTGYAAAYVIVFPAALIFAAIPKRNALLKGIIDGTSDARGKAERMLG